MRSRLFVHVTWTTRGREWTVDARASRALRRLIPYIAGQERTRILALGVVRSHVHLIAALHPTTAIPRLLQRLKGGTSVVLNRTQRHDPPLRWAKGYNIESVSPNALPQAVDYVRTQAQRHPDEAIADGPNPNSAALAAPAEPRL